MVVCAIKHNRLLDFTYCHLPPPTPISHYPTSSLSLLSLSNSHLHHHLCGCCQVNHLGHYLLTLELLPLLEATAQRTGDSRIIFVSSRRHVHGVFDPRNMNGELSYSRYCFYNNSKLYNVSVL